MDRVLEEETLVARKDHDCDACAWLDNELPDLTYSEAKAWVRAKRDGLKIKKGQTYFKSVSVYDGKNYCFRARLDIHAICLKYDTYKEP